MPSALETLVKILKLEREQGYKDGAVIGGLAAYGDKWSQEAHSQARRPEHHMLVDELHDRLTEYPSLTARTDRHNTVAYMLDRITGRIPTPETYANRDYSQYEMAAPPAQPSAQPPVDAPQADPGRQPEPERKPAPREQRPTQSGGQQPTAAQQAPRQERDRRERERPPKRGQERGGRDGQRQSGGRPQGRSGQGRDDDGGASPKRDDDFSRLDMDSDYGGGPRGPVKADIPAPVRLARPPRQPRPQIDPERAADILRGLSAPVDKIKGVGPKLVQMLGKMGIATVNDLLFYLPRRYDDYTRLVPIRRLQPDTLATVLGTVRFAELRIGKGGRKDFFIVVDDGTGTMDVTFFGMFYLERQIRTGQQLVLRGKSSIFRNRIQMTNPEIDLLQAEDLQSPGIVPVYPLTEGINQRTMRRLIKGAVEYWADLLPDYVPEGTLERTDLADLGWAVKNLHFPEGWDHLEHAQQRFIFDQLLLLQLAILANRRAWQSVPGQALYIDDDFREWFTSAVFPYPLTSAQIRAIEDIRRDIAKPVPMNRLLQGDVGSGKTAVAVTALGMALVFNKQGALMAPTSILAEQHYRNVSAMLEQYPGDKQPTVALLTSKLNGAEREAIYAGIADGSIDIVIGTHALIQEGVQFKDLAIAIIDEQHRFGVEQRGALRGKGTNPHLLVMTATPIPRTLALTLYADLDLSVLDEMPPGRTPIQTRVIEPIQRERAYHFIEEQVEAGRQAFIVYPLVEASDKIEAGSAVEAYEQLKTIFYHHRVGLLHGRMKPAEKDDIMEDFRQHRFDILVTTSVAEVGVDIANASVMLIEGANRFGLAQLHQFRGRVGRGQHASYCLLVSEVPIIDAHQRLIDLRKQSKGIEDLIAERADDPAVRLLALESTTDGFKLAEIDWQLRGPGDLIGTRQSGQTELKLIEAISPHLVAVAQREARTIYEEDQALSHEQHRLLAQRVAMVRDERSDLS